MLIYLDSLYFRNANVIIFSPQNVTRHHKISIIMA